MEPTSKKILVVLIFLILAAALAATVTALLSGGGPGPYSYTSIRGVEVPIYGVGLYKDMSAEVAPQGLAQDVITLFIAVPLLAASFLQSLRGSLSARYVFTGTVFYFLVTYFFYMVMAMYNAFFLVYVLIAGASFYSLLLSLQGFPREVREHKPQHRAEKWAGLFLMFNAVAIALLWLGVLVPPLFEGSIIPRQTEHYTTLIVQGTDLAILLPASFISGLLLVRKSHLGLHFSRIYLVFLGLLMTALTAKVLAMMHLGYPVVPAIFIIPLFNLSAVAFAVLLLRSTGLKTKNR